jgi:UPF0716 protein FxsA
MLFLVYLVFPILEIYLLFLAGKNLGFFTVLSLVILTAWLGSKLVKSQGLHVLSQFQNRMSGGEIPQKEALEGLMILFAGVLLIAPGFITDFLGILCLVPGTRQIMAEIFSAWIQRKIKQGSVKVYSNVGFGRGFGNMGFPSNSTESGSIRDVTPSDYKKLDS